MSSRLSVKAERMVSEFLKSKIKTEDDSIQTIDLYNALGGRAKVGYSFASFNQQVRWSRLAGAFAGYTCRRHYGWTVDDGREADRLARMRNSANNMSAADRRKHKQRIQEEAFLELLAKKTGTKELIPETTPPALPPAPPVQEVLVAQPVVSPPAQMAFPLEVQTLMERENAGFSIKMAEMATQFMQGMVDAMKEHAENMRMLMLTAKQMDG